MSRQLADDEDFNEGLKRLIAGECRTAIEAIEKRDRPLLLKNKHGHAEHFSAGLGPAAVLGNIFPGAAGRDPDAFSGN